ncbi:FG-GAP-like repeat-containing protein [Dactylosporangium sp. NPDC049742]|uniref:FG-GAP-like repeat-containing protein n=1 Tax=Dactylosporangium sp. NPDC049742 TaxID=3154737 RepID=UPI003413BABB
MASRNDVAAALASAKACGGAVEAIDRRTPTSRTVIGKNGTATVEHHVSPRWVRRADGSWTDLDTTLRFDGGTLAAAATLLPVTFSPGGSGPLATLTDGGRKLAMTWPGRALPKPVLSGATATYAEVLPGVDLRLTALAEGFSEVLVVHSAQAAANPALAQLSFGLQTTGVTLGTDADGGVHAKDERGAVVFSSPRATMWDTADAVVNERTEIRSAQSQTAGRAAPRVRAMGETLTGSTLKIVPDKGFLTDPATRYPVYIDPTFTGNKASNAWAVVASRSDLAGSKFWQTTFMSNSATYGDAGSGLTCDNFTGNTCTSPTYSVRSLFRMETYGAAGATVQSSNFEILQKWSWTCNPASDAKLWIVGGFDSNTTWNNQPAWDGGHTATVPANRAVGSPAGCANAGTVSFDTTSMVQYAIGQGWTSLSVGLRAVSEGTNLQWKRFDQSTAVLHIQYDHAPSAPALADLKVGDNALTSCGVSASAPTRVNTTNGLKLNAILNDADAAQGDLVKAEWAVTGVAAQHVPAAETAGLTSGSNHQATIPAAAFTNGAAVSWRVRGVDTDSSMAGGWSPWCYVLVDNTAPSPPGIASTDLALRVGGGIVPGAAATAVVGRSTTVTFTPNAADAGSIVGYRYGVAADMDAEPTIWLPANLGSTVTAAVVPLQAVFYNSIVVTAVKADGTAGTNTSARFRANPGTVTPAVAGDATGDGRADLTALSDVGGGKSALWRWDSTATGSGLNAPLAPQGNAGVFTNGQSLTVPGDFDADGLSDTAVFAQSGSDVTVAVQRSDANRLLTQPVSLTMSGWTIAKMKPVGGDFNADGKADLAVGYDLGNGNWSINVLLSTSTPGAVSFAAPVAWFQYPAGASDPTRVKLLSGDFNGDGRTDIAQFFDYGAAQTKLWVHWAQTNSTFGSPILQWDSGPGYWYWSDSNFVAGDFTGDGKTDIAAIVAPNHTFNGTTATATFLAKTDGTGVNGPVVQWNSGANAWDWAKVTGYPGDFDGDGKTDLGLLYRCCGPYQAQVWISTSTGTNLPEPVRASTGGIGPVGSASVVLGPGRYQLVNAASQTCASLALSPGGPPVNGQPCAATDSVQKFTFTPHSPQYVSIHSVGMVMSCLAGSGIADSTAVGYGPCEGVETWPTPAQYWTVEYVSGAPSAAVVRLIALPSGKCLNLDGALAAPFTPISQRTCDSQPAQQWLLRPVA